MVSPALVVVVEPESGCPGVCAGVKVCEPKAAVLPGGGAESVLPLPVEIKLTPSLSEGGAVHFGELHLQQNLLRAHRPEGKHVDYFGRVGGSEFSGALGNIFGGHMSGENNGGARGRDRDLLIGEYAMLFFSAGADVDVDAKIEAARAFQFIPDEKRYFSGSFAMHQNLRRRDDLWRRQSPGSVTEMRFRRSVVLMSSDFPTMTRSGAEPCVCCDCGGSVVDCVPVGTEAWGGGAVSDCC
jgi:hypothetical protein